MKERSGKPSDDAEADRPDIIEPSIEARSLSVAEACGDALADDPQTVPHPAPRGASTLTDVSC